MTKKAVIDLAKVEALASRGLTREQVAHNLGLTARTLRNHDAEMKGAIEDAYCRGKDMGIHEIANALYEKAKKGNTTAQIFFLKCNGWKEESAVEVKNTAPVQLIIKNDLKD